MSINKDKNIKGILPGVYFGDLWQTFNIDLEKYPGRIALSDKLRRFSSGLGVVSKFIRTNATGTDQWFGIVTDTDILRNGNPIINSGTWITDDTTGTFNDPKDGVVHEFANGEERLLVTRATNIAILNKSGGANVWDDDWWTTVASGPALTTNIAHPIARLQRLVAVGDKVSDVPVIHTLDKNDVVSNSRLTFGAQYTIRNIYTSSNRFWIGLQHDRGGNAKIVEWDGFSSSQNNEYELPGATPLSGFIVDDIPYFICSTGQIMRYTGGGFSEFTKFPCPELRVPFNDSNISTYGCFVDSHNVYINVNAPTLQAFSATVVQRGSRRLRAGVWILNVDNRNLYHHMGIGEYASAGTDVNYGTSPLAGVGALMKSTDINELIISASVYTGGTLMSTQTNGIYLQEKNINQTSNTGRNRGYFITPYIPINDVEGMWESIVLKFKRFVNSDNRIILKWRVLDPLYNASAQDQAGNAFEEGGINAPITWVNTTSFTCKVPTGVSVGNEVEILVGDNAGCSFSIASLSGTPDNSTTLTVTLNETAPTSSTDTAMVRFDNWKKEEEISATDIGNKRIAFTSSGHGEFIQLKVELQGFDIQVDDLIPVLKVKTSVKQS